MGRIPCELQNRQKSGQVDLGGRLGKAVSAIFLLPRGICWYLHFPWVAAWKCQLHSNDIQKRPLNVHLLVIIWSLNLSSSLFLPLFSPLDRNRKQTPTKCAFGGVKQNKGEMFRLGKGREWNWMHRTAKACLTYWNNARF